MRRLKCETMLFYVIRRQATSPVQPYEQPPVGARSHSRHVPEDPRRPAMLVAKQMRTTGRDQLGSLHTGFRMRSVGLERIRQTEHVYFEDLTHRAIGVFSKAVATCQDLTKAFTKPLAHRSAT